MFWKTNKEREVVFIGPSYKSTMHIRYFDIASKSGDNFEIVHHHIEDGFLKMLLANGNERCIALSVIRSYEVVHEEVKK